MAQPPVHFGPSDIALGHAAYALLTVLIGKLIEKQVISDHDATTLVLECVSAQETGGPLNKIAAEILKQSAHPMPPGTSTPN